MNQVTSLSKASQIRRLNKAELAECFDVSPQAVDGWIRRGCPFVERGAAGGKPWVFDLLAVAGWRFASTTPEGEQDPERMTPGDRKLWYDGEQKRREIQIADMELYPRDNVIRVITTTIAVFAEQVRSLPDKLEREVGLTPVQAETAERVMDDQLETLKLELLKAMGDAAA